MSEPLTRQKPDTPATSSKVKDFAQKAGRSVCALASAVREWWRVEDAYQQRARGWAVSGLVFALMNVFAFGLLSPLSFLAIVFCVVALLRGNRSSAAVFGLAVGVLGLVMSAHVSGRMAIYATDVAALKAFLENIMTGVQSTIASLI